MSPVTVENEALRIEVYPQNGGKVSSIVDKADKFELLFDYAAELPTSPQYDRPYAESWNAGWDECFPAVAAGNYPKHPYKGISIPDHGELWGLPTTAVPAKDGITTVWHGLRFGYVFTRKLCLEGNSIVAEYTLLNLAPFNFRFVWAQHGLLSLAVPIEVDIASIACRISHYADARPVDEPFIWPTTRDGSDLSRPGSLPAKQAWKIFTNDPIASAARLSFPTRRRHLTIDYTSSDGLPAWWGIWLNSGGWLGHKHLAIEPTTGRFDQLDRSVQDDSAGRIEPGGKREWAVRWTVG